MGFLGAGKSAGGGIEPDGNQPPASFFTTAVAIQAPAASHPGVRQIIEGRAVEVDYITAVRSRNRRAQWPGVGFPKLGAVVAGRNSRGEPVPLTQSASMRG
jgi:hypothetical protein